MMWLDEIEEKLHDGMLRDNENEERMSRVLREFMEGLEILNELYLQPEYRMTDDQTVDMKNFFDELSDDAKELLS